MNVIRTQTVDLTVIPAIAYKQKLAAGGAGLKLIRVDGSESASATIDKRSLRAVPYQKFDESKFPPEAFDEAMELLAGMPYSSRGKVVLRKQAPKPAEAQLEEETGAGTEEVPAAVADMMESKEYKAIVDTYQDAKGRLNYPLMNKEFIQFASKSKTVAEMIGHQATTDELLIFIVKSRAAHLANQKDSLDDNLIQALIDTLDEIDPRSAFKELKAHLNKMQARK